jgi:hypothetical protein
MSPSFEASKSIAVFEAESTHVVVIEMRLTKWSVAAMVPGFARQPLKKIDVDAEAPLQLPYRGAVRPHKPENPWRAWLGPAKRGEADFGSRAGCFRASNVTQHGGMPIAMACQPDNAVGNELLSAPVRSAHWRMRLG